MNDISLGFLGLVDNANHYFSQGYEKLASKRAKGKIVVKVSA